MNELYEDTLYKDTEITDKEINMDGKTLLIEFINGIIIKFNTIECGQIKNLQKI